MRTLYLRARPEPPEDVGAHWCTGSEHCGTCLAIANFNEESRDWNIRRVTLGVLKEAGLIKVIVQ